MTVVQSKHSINSVASCVHDRQRETNEDAGIWDLILTRDPRASSAMIIRGYWHHCWNLSCELSDVVLILNIRELTSKSKAIYTSGLCYCGNEARLLIHRLWLELVGWHNVDWLMDHLSEFVCSHDDGWLMAYLVKFVCRHTNSPELVCKHEVDWLLAYLLELVCRHDDWFIANSSELVCRYDDCWLMTSQS